MRVIKTVIGFLMLILFIAGMGLFLYPCINGVIQDAAMEGETELFFDRIENDRIDDMPFLKTPEELAAMEHEGLWNAMCVYNEDLWERKQESLSDPWSYEQPSFQLGEYGLNEEVFAVIQIPRLELVMPIYLGATEKHLTMGAAHLSQTSLPIGGENTNCVIAGHRGWKGSAYFRDIPKLQPGDEVLITNLWGELSYTVTATKVIAPNEIDEILIQQGRDMVTLITCYKLPNGRKDRFLVFCDRT